MRILFNIADFLIAGRSTGKLAEVRDLFGGPSNLPLISADASDPASLKAMAENAKVIISTVAPYQLYGEGLVAACAAAGTDYVDLCNRRSHRAGACDPQDSVRPLRSDELRNRCDIASCAAVPGVISDNGEFCAAQWRSTARKFDRLP